MGDFSLDPGDVIHVYDSPIWVYVDEGLWLIVDTRCSAYGRFAQKNSFSIMDLKARYNDDVQVWREGVWVF